MPQRRHASTPASWQSPARHVPCSLMVAIHHEGHAHAPLGVTFAFLDDYRNATKWMFGLAQFVPNGDQDQGLGAKYDGKFQVKPVSLHSTILITEWEQDALIAFKSISGFRNESRWRFEALGPEETKVIVDFEYWLPGGIAGKALGKALEPIVALSVRHSDHELRKCVQAEY